MKPILDKYNLPCVATHRSIADFDKDIDEVIEYNKILGSPVAGIGSMGVEYAESMEALNGFCQKANFYSEKLKEEGLKFGYHNHAYEFYKLSGKYVLDYIIENTDCVFIADTFWFQVGGKDPAKMLKKLGKRAEVVHFKDCAVKLDEWKKPAIAEVGRGNLDWDEIISVCEEIGVKDIVVEQDFCDGDPFESLKMSIDFLAGKGFEK